ncbi:GNAT family N-acetyltransferase [Thalassovita aquimarina]|uniref:GNAT family N-acetyltransferase n=1 Tax=Thalassovita aquimarina TaxID=2785917 RepID=A0ABS5HR97_9RHOB|nr:GNAT family N-acetyltransferase [Thalassovita aquimarina]MBR9651123.1 GNAT family N-acetyltransferase [Thalassovita aquimarina]
MIIVEQGDPHAPQATALLQQSHALMRSLFPPEDNFFLSIDGLCAPNIAFFTARKGDTVLGTGALAAQDGYGEVKSMFVAEEARGKGVADALMRQIEDEARARNLPWLKLETGNVLHAAHRLYERHGFTRCGPFGGYPEAASSIFMEKKL